MHIHKDENGVLRRCYHICKHWISPGFVLGFIIASTTEFGPEHYLWEKVWPFYKFTAWMEKSNLAPLALDIGVDISLLIMIALSVYFTIKKVRYNHEQC